MGAIVHAADIQDRDGTPVLRASIRQTLPRLRQVFAAGGYAGPKLKMVLVPSHSVSPSVGTTPRRPNEAERGAVPSGSVQCGLAARTVCCACGSWTRLVGPTAAGAATDDIA